jgi:hypothetical protein
MVVVIRVDVAQLKIGKVTLLHDSLIRWPRATTKDLADQRGAASLLPRALASLHHAEYFPPSLRLAEEISSEQ